MGVLLGLVLFGVETLLILRANSIGLNVDTAGPLKALLAAVRPAVPGLIARVVVAYAVAGAVLGLVAGRLAGAASPGPTWRRFGLTVLNIFLLAGVASWNGILHRPALADDVPALELALTWMVNHGRTWHPLLFASLTLLPQAALWAWRTGPLRVTLVAGVTLAMVLVSSSVSPSGSKHPLFVLIGIDAFRPDRVEAQGLHLHVAPNLERFLGDATRFTRAYTPIAQTEPAWRSLLTAEWPWRTGDRYPLTAPERRRDLPTFAELFTQGGYRTTFVTDCSRFNYLDASSGFSERIEPPQGAINFFLEKLRYRALGVFADNAVGSWWLPEFIDNRALAGIHNPLGFGDRLARRLTDEAAEGATFFAYHATAAHFPGDPVFPFYRKYLSAREPLARRLRMYFSPLSAGAQQGSWSRAGAEGLYDELLMQADAQLGELLDALRAEGVYDQATIVVFSDHGESFHADFPELAGATPVHGARLGEEENRILLAVKLPKTAPGAHPSTSDALVRLIDLGPTFLELARLQPLPDADGVSLLPLLEGRPMPELKLYAETGFTHVTPDVFDAGHFSGGTRGFDAYAVLPNGVVEMTPHAHEVAMAEKDVGAFDGAGWLIRSPRKDGTVEERCVGACAPSLSSWLNAVREPDRVPVRPRVQRTDAEQGRRAP